MAFDPSGLYHAGARHYNPGLGRFLSEDPERGKANLFEYAGDNAVMDSDLSGMGDCPGGDCGGGFSNDSEATGGDGFDLLSLFQAIVDFLFGSQSSAQPVGPTPA
jgi:hypothetical protein